MIPTLRALTEHILIERGLRAQGSPQLPRHFFSSLLVGLHEFAQNAGRISTGWK
jgi:hypothetical protein